MPPKRILIVRELIPIALKTGDITNVHTRTLLVVNTPSIYTFAERHAGQEEAEAETDGAGEDPLAFAVRFYGTASYNPLTRIDWKEGQVRVEYSRYTATEKSTRVAVTSEKVARTFGYKEDPRVEFLSLAKMPVEKLVADGHVHKASLELCISSPGYMNVA